MCYNIIHMKKQNLDQKLIEKIIKRAEGYMRMSGALMVDAAFGRAAKEVLADKYPGAWGEYKKVARGIYLNRQKELDKFKHDELLQGAQEAAWARNDQAFLDAEADAEAKEDELLARGEGRKNR